MIYIGIDPGINGAWAWIGDARNPYSVGMGAKPLYPACGARTFPLAGDLLDVRALAHELDSLIGDFDPLGGVIVTLEKAQAMPKNGAVSMFNYGRTVGRTETTLMFIRNLRLRVEEVRPPAWKKVVLAGTAKDKAAAIEYVTRAFPGVSLLATERSRTPHDGMADALCIAEYGRRMFPS